jgi:hypothetical protein
MQIYFSLRVDVKLLVVQCKNYYIVFMYEYLSVVYGDQIMTKSYLVYSYEGYCNRFVNKSA